MFYRILSAFILTFSLNAHHANARDTVRGGEAQIAALPAEYQKLHHYLRDLEKIGATLKTLDFEQGKGLAMSVILFGKGRDPLYTINLSQVNGEEILLFGVLTECTVSDFTAPLIETSIKLDGQKISVYYACKREDAGTTKVYTPKTKAGKEAIVLALKTKKVVFVTFDQTEVPFQTPGFAAAWDEILRPAL